MYLTKTEIAIILNIIGKYKYKNKSIESIIKKLEDALGEKHSKTYREIIKDRILSEFRY